MAPAVTLFLEASLDSVAKLEPWLTGAFPSPKLANSDETFFDSCSSSTLGAVNVDGSRSIARPKPEVRLNNSVAVVFDVVVVVIWLRIAHCPIWIVCFGKWTGRPVGVRYKSRLNT
jgi:hypothetical protein